MADASEWLTVGQVADALGVQSWQVSRMYERGLLPEPPRIGLARVIHRDGVGEVRDALEMAGYLENSP